MNKPPNPTLMRALVALRETAKAGCKFSFTFDHGIVVDKEWPLARLYLMCDDDGGLDINVRLDRRWQSVGSLPVTSGQDQITGFIRYSLFYETRR